MLRNLALFVISSCLAAFGNASSLEMELLHKMSQQAPGLNKNVLQRALTATECARVNGIKRPESLAIIDFSLPSSEKRLWVFDLKQGNLLFRDLVAHGKNSGELSANSFSNEMGSLQSSLGLFLGEESYYGKHGYSLRLAGLEPGINDNARDRAIVVHGASYVDSSWVKTRGRLGRSFGCPAVRQAIARKVVDTLKEGQLLFSFYPDRNWLESSPFLNCEEGKPVFNNTSVTSKNRINGFSEKS